MLPTEFLKVYAERILEDRRKEQESVTGAFLSRALFETRRAEGFYVPIPEAKTELLSPDGEVLMRDGEMVEKEMKVSFKHTIRFR